jgi:hypothetical protein
MWGLEEFFVAQYYILAVHAIYFYVVIRFLLLFHYFDHHSILFPLNAIVKI